MVFVPCIFGGAIYYIVDIDLQTGIMEENKNHNMYTILQKVYRLSISLLKERGVPAWKK